MAAEQRWLFTRSQLENTPSRRCGIDSDKELNYRQNTANFIQEMGQKLQVSQLTINTAIVFMHRFYMFHSFSRFTRNNIGTACLFLAAKVEEQPRKLEHLIRMAHQCQNPGTAALDVKSEAYLDMAQELVVNENILLQTLGFNLHVDHPHSYVVKTTQMVRASKDLAQASYFLATNREFLRLLWRIVTKSLHLTTLCLQQPPAHVACVCIHIACKWSDLEIPRSSEGKQWFQYTDKDMTIELLEELTSDFLTVLDKCPSKLKKKILTWKKDAGGGGAQGVSDTDVGPPIKKVKHEASAAAGSAAQAGGHRPSDGHRKLDHRGDPHHDKQRPPGSHGAHSRYDPARVKPDHHGARPDHPNMKREPGYHEKREPGYHDPHKRDANLHNVKLEHPAGRHPHALAPQDAGLRRNKTEPSLSMTPKEYKERKQKEQALQAQHQRPSHRPGEPRPDPFKAPGSDRHHPDLMAHKERSAHHGARPGSEQQHRKEQHAQRPHRPGAEHKPRLTSPPPNSKKAQSNMSDMLEKEIQRQKLKVHKGPAPPAPDPFRSQHEQKPRPPVKEREGVFSLALQNAPAGPEQKRLSGEKPGDLSREARMKELPPLNISPARSRARTSSSSSDISPTVARMRKDDRRLSQDPIVHLQPLPQLPGTLGHLPGALGPLPSEIGLKSPPPAVPVAPDILAYCEQASAGVVSPAVAAAHPSPSKPEAHMRTKGLKTPVKGEKSNNNNGEITDTAPGAGAGAFKREERPAQHRLDNRESDSSSFIKKEKERHERKSRERKAAEKAERSDLKLKISLTGSPNIRSVRNEEAKKNTSSPSSLTTSDGIKLKIKLNNADQSSASAGYGSDREKHDSKAHAAQEQKPLKMVLKLPPSGGEEKERHHHHRHKKHKHKDRHKEDRHSRKRAHSPGDGSHHSTSSRHSSSSHHPPSSKVPRSDSIHNNTHGNGRHLDGGGGSNRGAPVLSQMQQSIDLLNKAVKIKGMELQRSLSLQSGPPLPPPDRGFPPPPPPSDAPPLPPGPPPPQ